MPIQLVINPILGLMIFIVLYEIKPLSLLIAWYGFYLLIFIERGFIWHRYKKSNKAEGSYKLWGNRFIWNATAFAISWGIFFNLFFEPTQVQYNSFLIVVVAGFTAGAFAFYSAYYKAFFYSTILALFPMIIRLIMEGGKFNIMLSLMCLLYIMILLLHAKKAHKNYQLAMISNFKYQDINIELEKQKDKVVEAYEAKSRFISTASHDVRQPLHALQLFSQALKRQNKNPELNSLVNNISVTTRSLSDFFNQLLDFSRIETKSIEPEYKIFRISEIIERLFIEYEMKAITKGLELHIVPSTAIVDSDPHFLERIIRNLLSNAIRYTHKGKILIGCRRKKRTLTVEVHDTGIGIARKDQKKIFNEFYQVKNQHKKQGRGVGLGLSIGFGLAKLLNTELKIKSKLGYGCCFSIEIPMIKNTNNPDNSVIEDQTDSSLLNCKIEFYCSKEIDKSVLNAVKLWCPDGIVSDDLSRIFKYHYGSSQQPDVILIDEVLFTNKLTQIDYLFRTLEKRKISAQIILLTDKSSEIPAYNEKYKLDIRCVQKPVKPAMLRLMIDQ
jgi:two-component system, sensor histidine kinase